MAAQCAIVVQQYEGIYQEMIHNRVAPAEVRRGIAGIVTDLDEFAKKSMPDIAAAMDTASNNKDRASSRAYAVATAAALDELVMRLEGILDDMLKMESRQELAYRLKRIIDLVNEIWIGIGGEIKGQGGKIFDPDEDDKKDK